MILLFRDDTVGTIYLLIHDIMHYEGENKNIVNKREREDISDMISLVEVFRRRKKENGRQ